ncbi:hypothetical protein Y032_0030g2235 [Ancylostoma ceylanicum]|nr:hypothetical protein Y032_0030g2235 [Ancylostoma ceylanicum]
MMTWIAGKRERLWILDRVGGLVVSDRRFFQAPPNHSNEHIDGVINGEISEYTKLRGPRTIADDVADIELYNEPSHSTTTATPINSSSSYRYRQDMSELREDLERIVFLKRVIEQLKAGMELGVHHGVNIALQIRTRADPFQPFKSL